MRRNLRGCDQRRPSASTFTVGAVLAKDYDAVLLSVDPYDPDIDDEFIALSGRLRIRISYASPYAARQFGLKA